jgi:RNA polymerase sigma factor (sigma-70 family)
VPTAKPARSRAKHRSAERIAEQIYIAHRSRLLAIAKRNFGSPELAEDAVQDALVLFMEHFDPTSQAPPLAWLSLTLKRRCWEIARNQRRDRAKRPEQDIDRCSQQQLPTTPIGQPEEMLDLAEEIATTRRRLEGIKRDERRAISLLAFGYSYSEIRDLTGWSHRKVARCVTEGRSALRQLAHGGAT